MKAVITEFTPSECCRQRRECKVLAIVCVADSGLLGQGEGQEM